jgi:hypothetical protein
MTLQSLFGVTGSAMVLGIVAACGGGAGPLVTTTSGDGRDDPGSTYDTPPSTSDGSGGNCLVCDVTYDCPGFAQGGGVSLSTSDGTCTQALINVVCSGALFGTAPCTGGGSGGAFTCGSIVCTPETQTGGSSGSGSSSGATPGGGVGEDAGVPITSG